MARTAGASAIRERFQHPALLGAEIETPTSNEIVSSLGALRNPRSMMPIAVVLKPERSARYSCEKPAAQR
jgi:hypothetical protein